MKFRKAVIAICAIAIAIAGIAMLASTAKADATIKAEWTYAEVDELGIFKYQILDKDNLVVVDNIAPALRAWTWDEEEECNAWHLLAVAGSPTNPVPSDRSNSAVWCPPPAECPECPECPEPPPPTTAPTTFNITGSITLDPQ